MLLKGKFSTSVSTILFDLDDTLYLERHFVFGGFQSVAGVLEKKYGVEEKEVWKRMVALFELGERELVFDRILEEMGVKYSQEVISHLVDVYRHHSPCLSLADDAIGALEWASGNRKLGIVTDGYGTMQRNKVAALGLGSRVDVVVYSDDLGREHWKPSAQPFLRALHAMSAEPIETIYVADNPHKDFIGARALGMGTVRIRRVGGLYADITLDNEHEADHEIYSLLELDHIYGSGAKVENNE